jgi:hypothetical protein
MAATMRAQNTGIRIVVGPEILVSRGEDFPHVETMLAANPTDARHLLASSILRPRDSRGRILSRTRAYVSRDAGRSWTASLLPEEDQWDPIVAFTPRGTALFAYLLPPKHLSVFRSDDGGASWKNRLDLPFVDGPMIAVDWTRGQNRGHVYLAARLGEGEGPFVVYRSTDDARTFDTSVAIAAPLARRAFNLVVLSDGTLFVPFSTVGRTLQQISGLRSTDGGRTFSAAFPIAARQPNPRDTGDTPPAVFAAGRHDGRERLYVVYTVYAGNSNARLMTSHSDDGGRTWSESTRVTASVGEEVTQGAANLSVNRDGVVGVSWLERNIRPMAKDDQAGHFNETYDLFFTASLDGGRTFLTPVKVSSQSSRPAGEVGRFFPGQDYMLTDAAVDGTFHLLWPDARTGVFQLLTAPVRIK